MCFPFLIARKRTGSLSTYSNLVHVHLTYLHDAHWPAILETQKNIDTNMSASADTDVWAEREYVECDSTRSSKCNSINKNEVGGPFARAKSMKMASGMTVPDNGSEVGPFARVRSLKILGTMTVPARISRPS
ncbi:hypothetical protein CLAFUW4_06547 [Fulvia fulva]|uniref:Uncharacterized protein n=1 Tax=Passalora fulva TaxID=5499 RepID=A0A9Q8PBK7_PASFU|nr:uncharacterized protein CLAFUR5_06693 [Fulvia fulva]KAK4621842.1 hypothetical protein CLAFUR4_06555 [Fulvia fulva]KAK4623109.1 hypothetical protein CLAFUR0_06551 [Fulvia fulva]UJO19425.1 hypothetical protein CLAFUR5_06693 [Fulvia fulva]WPV16258.1 hypothetical protein CLAFUW4_06547 [Fulvia fulva]WPV31261.1 hypothetical protein CLAFUW7_06546 [Fulvia fulva]